MTLTRPYPAFAVEVHPHQTGFWPMLEDGKKTKRQLHLTGVKGETLFLLHTCSVNFTEQVYSNCVMAYSDQYWKESNINSQIIVQDFCEQLEMMMYHKRITKVSLCSSREYKMHLGFATPSASISKRAK